LKMTQFSKPGTRTRTLISKLCHDRGPPRILVVGSSRVKDTPCHTAKPVFAVNTALLPISFKSCLPVSIQFFFGLPILRFIVFTSQCMTCFGSLPSSIRETCPSHLNLLSLIMKFQFLQICLLPDLLVTDFSMLTSKLGHGPRGSKLHCLSVHIGPVTANDPW